MYIIAECSRHTERKKSYIYSIFTYSIFYIICNLNSISPCCSTKKIVRIISNTIVAFTIKNGSLENNYFIIQL